MDKLFLTQLKVDKTQALRRRLTDAYAWHSGLWQCFSEGKTARRDFLFRCDEEVRAFRILMLSGQKPIPPGWGQMDTQPVHERFLSYPTYRFQIKANPTMRRDRDRRRIGIYHLDKLAQWMKRKADTCGFSLVGTLDIVGPSDAPFYRKGTVGKHTWADFRGTLEVKDRQLFSAAFKNGIGSAKSFGYGMLMLNPFSTRTDNP